MSGLLSPIIALLINKSLTTGCFPAEFIVHRTVAAEGDGLDLHASFQLELKQLHGRSRDQPCHQL